VTNQQLSERTIGSGLEMAVHIYSMRPSSIASHSIVRARDKYLVSISIIFANLIVYPL
jgi:hypothetical protein